jgi:hypothetical protein
MARMKEPHIGTELEIDNGGRNGKKAIEITTALGYPANESLEFKCSRDGSLNNGFEIISMPATMEYHLTKYNWEAGMEKARQLGYGSHDPNTCGLHFHIDRTYFQNSMTMPEEGFIILVTNNWSWLEPFSRRNNFHYCSFRGSRERFTPDSFKSENSYITQNRLDDLRSAYRGHNVALNFGGNSTIEVRFIRGTLKYRIFVASLQLMEMIAYAVKHFRKEQLANIDLKWFKRFAKRRTYTAFLEYLEARGIMA